MRATVEPIWLCDRPSREFRWRDQSTVAPTIRVEALAKAEQPVRMDASEGESSGDDGGWKALTGVDLADGSGKLGSGEQSTAVGSSPVVASPVKRDTPVRTKGRVGRFLTPAEITLALSRGRYEPIFNIMITRDSPVINLKHDND
ncbi:hypothetical protein N7532_004444 [Penicillium argentinense]|uniref:Uncharacterized protein n=1 Tax=Penicillium argentinense TaxID=1131581 RepID=A0A9W9FPF4_9EURO|nr:uncharacterized protein N7532_004444 [Penicillium argentinense]KAJ5103915.1 hypothetical protein N7532_004444 [Penicillium argentinense]